MKTNLQRVPSIFPALFLSLCAGTAHGQGTSAQTPAVIATVTSFQTSLGNNGWRYLTASVHLQNRTKKPLILGCDRGKVGASDDRGNRYVVTAMRGIGAISGTTVDPKFVLAPESGGDALVEMRWRGAANTEFGVTFDMSLTVREIATLESGQLKLGAESLLEFSGLKTGYTAMPVADHTVNAGPFTAQITRSKVGTSGRRWQTMDVTIRLTNTSDKPLILGYESTSSYGTDDQGNRWGYGTAGSHDTSFSGIGLVTSAQADPQLALAPGASKDVRFTVVRQIGRETAGTQLVYSVALQGLEILASGQVREVRQYSLTFPGLSLKN